jgi:hypothetical protein
MLGYLPSTARLNSTACVSPTSTYSLRSKPSSSVSPGIIEPSVDNGLRSGRETGKEGLDVARVIGEGATTGLSGGLQRKKVTALLA